MSEVFEGYERQYCEASASLTRKCTAAAALQGGNPPPFPNPAISVAPSSESSIHWIFGRAEKLKQKAAEIQSGIDGAEALVSPRLSFLFFVFFVCLFY